MNEAVQPIEKDHSPIISLEEQKPSSPACTPIIVEYHENDPENPQNWALWSRWSIVMMVAIINIGTIIIVPAVPLILHEFNMSSDSLDSTLLVSIWDLGEVAGQFLVGPLSERYGRMPVFHAGNVFFILCSVAAALSTNMSMLVAFRFLNGVAVTSITLGPSGYIADALGWRWIIWLLAIIVAVVTVLSFAVFRETYRVKILQRKASRLRKETGNENFQSAQQENTQLLGTLIQPMRILFSSAIVFVISFYTALTYGISYVILTTLAEIMQETYRVGEGPLGLLFLGRAVGNTLGVILNALFSDRYIRYKKAKGETKPELRLPLMVFGAVTLPLGLLVYGWTMNKDIPWIAPIIGTGISRFSTLLTILPTSNYLVDVFDPLGTSASAVAACAIMQGLIGAILPLAGPRLYDSLGYGWGNSLLAFIS
ncbi:hypothetical protein TCE0_041r13627 [Talaromyces pinophilus]|uniref:Major facilitator superfamily (MFS) profile domain-containing protein n=1 Tax=Talaromyces pinophilus TaxID=128442 RepID=A0A6V8HG74_TALPI|nr:hypothetical protein TCE0_041r13627 [Talaromyces pinophilus]